MHGKHIRRSLMALLLAAVAGCANTGSPPQAQSTPAADATAPGGAQSGNPSAYPAPESPATGNSAYPAPSAAPADAYPGPITPQPVEGRAPEPVPQPAAGMAVIHGMVYDVKTDQAIFNGVTVYLSPVINTSSSEMSAVSADTANDPNVTPDREGGFAFADVKPGRYGIVVRGPLNQYLARYSTDQSKDVIVTVEAGQTLDLGKIYSGYP